MVGWSRPLGADLNAPQSHILGYSAPLWPLVTLLGTGSPVNLLMPAGFLSPFMLFGALLTTYRPFSYSTLCWPLDIIPAAQSLLAGDAGGESYGTV